MHALCGLVLLPLVAILFSADRRAIRPRIVLASLALQLAIGGIVLFLPPGRAALAAVANGVAFVLRQSAPGISFVFGHLGEHPADGFVFAIRVLPQIIYIAAIIELLYYLRVIPFVAGAIGRALTVLLGVSPITAFAAVLTTLLGQSELPIGIRPAIRRLTRAELFATMSSGAASIAGSIIAGYASLGIDLASLLAASVMAIPGGLLFANILLPERERGDPAPLRPDGEENRLGGMLEAISVGVGRGVHVAVMVGAMLIAFISLIALVDAALAGLAPGLSLEHIFGLFFAPVAWAIGVPAASTATVGRLIGEKLVFNEFVGYVDLARLVKAGVLTDRRTTAIATFALCGFANFSSAAILLAAFGSVAETRRAEIAALAMRAVLAGTLSNLMSADIAAIFLA